MIATTTRMAALSVALLAVVFTGRGPAVSAGLSAVALAKADASAKAGARQAPQDLAAKLSGTWVFNRDLSAGFGRSGRGRGGPRPAALFAVAPGFQGRGGGGGGGGDQSDLTPEQRAERAAMQQLQQTDTRITIKASAAEITFTDTRGENTFPINDKTTTIFVAASPVKVKLKWDKQVLRQEFSNTQAKLVQIWSVDGSDRLVMTAKVESLTLMTPERKAVFDRQQTDPGR